MKTVRQQLVVFGILLAAFSLCAQEEAGTEQAFNWQKGPTTGELADIGTVKVPEGYSFLGPDETKELMKAMGNLVSDTELGTILSPDDWFVIFEFDEIGFVKDDDQDSLDAGKLMTSFLEAQEKANKMRSDQGFPELEVIGWYREPFYDQKTHNLEWCTTIQEKGSEGQFANYNLRVLGRRGVTRVTLVADLDQLDLAVPETKSLIDGFEYLKGQRYSEYRKGDKVAKYGLAALVLGGAAAVAVKTGLFKYLWKFLILGAAAIGGVIKKVFKRDS